MSFAKRALENLPEYAEVEVIENDAFTAWQVASDDDIHWLDAYLTPNDGALFATLRLEADIHGEEYAIEDDYDWIRRGC